MGLPRTIEDIKADLKHAEELAAPLALRVRELQRELLLLNSPFKIGDLIEWSGQRGYIREIARWCEGCPKFQVQRVLKNGALGQPVWVYRYHNPKLVSANED